MRSTGVRPAASSADVRVRMSHQARRDTGAELLLRHELFRRGLRYRVDAPLPTMPRRRADLTFAGPRVVVFVDGCFWHMCPLHATWPKSNSEWWREKLRHNHDRDVETDERLAALGWTVVRVWEHEEILAAADRVERAVRTAHS